MKIIETNNDLIIRLLDKIPLGIVIIGFNKSNDSSDAVFKIINVNKHFQKLFGIDFNKLTPKSLWEKFPVLYNKCYESILKKDNSKPVNLIYDDNGNSKIYKIEIHKLSGNYFSIVFNDITQYQIALNALKDCELRYKTVAEYNHDWEYWITPDNKLEYISPSCFRITGYSSEEFSANPNLLTEIIYPGDKKIFFKHLKNEFGDNKYRELDFRITTNNRETKWISHRCQPVYNNEGVFLGRRASNTDITERKKVLDEMKQLIVALKLSQEITQERADEIFNLNEMLTRSESQLKELNASKDKFFSIIAHDLKTPFVGFLGLTKLLSNDIEGMEKKEIKEYASILNNSAQHFYKLLENLLQWSRVQRGTIQYNPENVLLKAISDLTINLLLENARLKKIAIINNIPDDLMAYSDVNILNTILRNLISNAIKFTNYGGEIILSAKDLMDTNIEISVKDNGVGMDTETIELLFKIDSTVSTVGTANESGTGLGLILCKDFATINRGFIKVESIPEKGSTFSFTVPSAK